MMWHDRGVAPTPKQNIRIHPDRWKAAGERAARVHHTDRAKIVNAMLVLYGAGELDDQVSDWLARVTGVEHSGAAVTAKPGA
jgi:hypothetical protein